MTRKAFFSFTHKEDHYRADIVRSSWVTPEQTRRIASGFFDSAIWAEVKQKPEPEIEAWIDEQMKSSSVTVVLIGETTAGKKWIDYQIIASHKKSDGVIGIHINNIKDEDGNTTEKGFFPFDNFRFLKNDAVLIYPVYDWVADNGAANLNKWIEDAAQSMGK